MPIGDYLGLLCTDGVLAQVGLPDDGLLQVPAASLIWGRIKLGGSLIGSPSEIEEMLQLAVDKKVQPRIELRSMKDTIKLSPIWNPARQGIAMCWSMNSISTSTRNLNLSLSLYFSLSQIKYIAKDLTRIYMTHDTSSLPHL